MFAVLRRLGVVLVVAALALSVGPASAWASGLSRAQARELRLYDSGLVLARPGAGPALRKAGGVKLANALPIWRVPSRPALRVLPGLMRSNLVSVVAADQPLLPMATPAPPAEGTDWWIASVGANGAASPGAGKPLTIIDTGVDLTHEEFASRPATTALEPAEHLGAPRGARHRGGVGRCRSSEQRRSPRRLSAGQPLRLGREPQRAGITAGDVIQGLDAAMHLGAGVVNLSLGSQIRNPLLDTMIARVQAAGVLVVAAAGNSRQQGSPREYPASLPHVVTVGAIDSGNQPTYFTSGSPYVDLAAPGEIIYVAVPKTLHPPTSYDFFDGTSFASPIVAAAADWVWTVRPNLDWTQVAEVLRASAQDLYTPGFDSLTGFGRLNIPAALTVAPAPPDPQEPNEDVTYVRSGGFLHRSARPLTAARRKSGSVTARARRRGRPSRRLPHLGARQAQRGRRASAHGRRRRPRALGAEDRERARVRARAQARQAWDLGAKRHEARAASRQEHGRQGRLLLRRGVRRHGGGNVSRPVAGVGYRIAVSIVRTKTARR